MTAENGESPKQPWSSERKAQLLAEDRVLASTESFLSAQLRDIRERRTVIRSEIASSFNLPDDPGGLGYGRTETALDVSPTSPKGVIRGFRNRFSKPPS